MKIVSLAICVGTLPLVAEDPPRKNDFGAGKKVADSRFGMQLIWERARNAPREGDPAPDFELEKIDGKGTVRLSELLKKEKKPVVLVFGSFT